MKLSKRFLKRGIALLRVFTYTNFLVRFFSCCRIRTRDGWLRRARLPLCNAIPSNTKTLKSSWHSSTNILPLSASKAANRVVPTTVLFNLWTMGARRVVVEWDWVWVTFQLRQLRPLTSNLMTSACHRISPSAPHTLSLILSLSLSRKSHTHTFAHAIYHYISGISNDKIMIKSAKMTEIENWRVSVCVCVSVSGCVAGMGWASACVQVCVCVYGCVRVCVRVWVCASVCRLVTAKQLGSLHVTLISPNFDFCAATAKQMGWSSFVAKQRFQILIQIPFRAIFDPFRSKFGKLVLTQQLPWSLKSSSKVESLTSSS